jgi:hypothetical protein
MKHIPHGAYLDSIGHLCQVFQRSLSEVEAILTAAEITPALVLNDIRHYDRSAYVALREVAAGEAEHDAD